VRGAELLSSSKVVFWDFDGVIKDSIEIKSQGFANLFQAFGSAVKEQVLEHHRANSGMSRFDKIPLYLHWAGLKADPDKVSEYCDKYSQLVLKKVIDAPWVPGVEVFIRNNPNRQKFILVSATPQNELAYILHALDLTSCFAKVFGAPTSKRDAIRITLEACKHKPYDCLMIGDAQIDLEAAQANKVPFLLRQNDANNDMLGSYIGPSIRDLSEL
jgi:phosphoglycolate phosphatase-like HAD superfamily hydrolase